MKNLKQYLTIVFSLVLAFSCTNETIEKSELQQINYDELNLKVDEYLSSFEAHFKSEETLLNAFESFSVAEKFSDEPSMTIYLDLTSEKVKYHKDDLSNTYSDAQKTFLIAYFNEVANANGDELLSIISKNKMTLENASLTKEEYRQILFLLETGEKTFKSVKNILSVSVGSKTNDILSLKDNCFWNCMAGQGRNFGRGIAYGAISNGIAGAIIGGAAGTVTFPILGTAVGAVAGGAFGAAEGAIYGIIGAAFFSATDCATQCGVRDATGGRECINITGANKVCLKQIEL